MARRRRERIQSAYDVFHTAAAAALGAAQRRREAATRAHTEAAAELTLREDGFAAARTSPQLQAVRANPELSHLVERVDADRAAALEAWWADRDRSGPEQLRRIVARAAPRSAGAVDGWLGVGTAESNDPVPQLWRIGTGTVGVGGPEFPVAVPLLDASHLELTGDAATRSAEEALVESLLMRMLGYFRPGLVHLHVWDVGQFRGSLPGLYPLTQTGLLTVHDPGDLTGLLDLLSDRIRRVHTRVLVGGRLSLAQARATGERAEPWAVAVLLGNHRALADDDQRQLQRVLRGGPACGISAILVDIPLTISAPVESVRFRPPEPVLGGSAPRVVASTTTTGDHVTVVPDPPLPRAAVIDTCHAIVAEHERLRARIGTFPDLLPESTWGGASSKAGLCAPVGFTEGEKVDMVLADASPHALVGGPSGSGKTNLLLTMIASMAARYPPDELEFYLLDFKEGVSFAQFAPGSKDPTWLPHARLIGININTDREFGLALLQHLAAEMRRRAEVARAHEVTKLEELREEDPTGRWPRIVAVIDEFQFLFAERDAVSREAIRLLEDVARRGRSQGIHLVLASQDVSSIEAFWGRPAIFEQFVLRVALPRARRVLAEGNDAALHLLRWHAVLNHESGITHGNEIIKIADATAKGAVDKVQQRLYALFKSEATREPPLFDGSKAPRVAELMDRLPPAPVSQAIIGQRIDVDASPAAVPLPTSPGRNIGVIGTALDDAVAVLGTAAASLGEQHKGEQHKYGDIRFVLAPLVIDAEPAVGALETQLVDHKVETVRLLDFQQRIKKLAEEIRDRLAGEARIPVYLVLYAADAADSVLDRPGIDALRSVLHSGPEVGVHTIGWWRSPQRLRTLLTLSAAPDDLGCVVGLDVQGAELGTLVPGLPPAWSPRPGRALTFDRARHSRPEVVIVASLDDAPGTP